MHRFRIILGATTLPVLVALVAWTGLASDEAKTERVHDPALVQAVSEVMTALLHEDPAAAGAALDRMAPLCRPLGAEDESRYGAPLVKADRIFHDMLKINRETAAGGRADTTFDEFFWVLRTCRDCHAVARKEGLLPEQGALERAGS